MCAISGLLFCNAVSTFSETVKQIFRMSDKSELYTHVHIDTGTGILVIAWHHICPKPSVILIKVLVGMIQ